jgi:hypothetical protein
VSRAPVVDLPGVAPHNLEAERAVLGAILLEPGVLPRAIELLAADEFYKDGHRTIYRAMIRLYERSEPADVLTVTEELKRAGELEDVGGQAALSVMMEEATVATQFAAYARILHAKAQLRVLIQVAREISERGFDDGADVEALTTHGLEAFSRLCRTTRNGHGPDGHEPESVAEGLGTFLQHSFPSMRQLIEGLSSDEGGGWRGGEEKLGKTYYCLHEALCLALGRPVLGRYGVPVRRRVLFVEEEDGPRRTQRRIRALLRGMGLDPDDPALQAELSTWFRLVCWRGFTFDDPGMAACLEAEIAAFKPTVVYIDVLRKVTTLDIDKRGPAGQFLAALDRLRRQFGIIIFVVHHYRKSQGFRMGRGSQEIAGSQVLGAWGENSLFFEPIGRTPGAVKIEVQSKDLPPVPAFRLIFEAEGPSEDPTLVRLRAEALAETTTGAQNRDKVQKALQTLDRIPADTGQAGVPVAAIAQATKLSDKTVRQHLGDLRKDGFAVEAGAVFQAHISGKKGAKKIPLWLPKGGPALPEGPRVPLEGETRARNGQQAPAYAPLPEGETAPQTDLPAEGSMLWRKVGKAPRRGAPDRLPSEVPDPSPEVWTV